MANASLPEVMEVHQLFSEVQGVKGESSVVIQGTRLHPLTVLKILKTFPPVWNVCLTGFMVYDRLDSKGETKSGFYILGKHDFGTLSFIVADVTMETVDSVTTITQLS